MEKLKQASWRTFLFSVCGLAVIWDLARTGALTSMEFLGCFTLLAGLFAAKQAIEYKKKLNNGGTT